MGQLGLDSSILYACEDFARCYTTTAWLVRMVDHRMMSQCFKRVLDDPTVPTKHVNKAAASSLKMVFLERAYKVID